MNEHRSYVDPRYEAGRTTALSELRTELICLERKIVREVLRHVFPLLPYTVRGCRLSKNSFLRELLTMPMNYWRSLETPLTFWALQPKPGQVVLDLSSPKLLGLYLSFQGYFTIATDVSDYFVRDLQQLRRELSVTTLEMAVTAGQHLPLRSNSIDRAYAISVLEHIPDRGDAEVIAEVRRVLKPGGMFCLTVPFFSRYIEEFRPSVYWAKFSFQDQRGVFFQRRYDSDSLEERLLYDPCFETERLIYMAEKPLVQPRLREDLCFEENYLWLNRRILSMLTRAASTIPFLRLPVPMLAYFVQSSYSHRYHYLTGDAQDKNVRGVFICLRKK